MKLTIEKIKNKVEEWWDEVTFFFHNPFGLRTLYERITGTIEYAVFIFKNNTYREWDYCYLYDLIEFKLKRMKKCLENDSVVYRDELKEMCNEIEETLAYYQVYKNIEDGGHGGSDHVDVVREMYRQQQIAWRKFHEMLSNNAQNWWS